MDKNYKHCKNCDSDCCVIWAGCNSCYYYEDKLICSNCGREIVDVQFKRKNGCQWCVPEKQTRYCTGEY